MVNRRSPSLPGNFLNYLTALALVDMFLIMVFFLENAMIDHISEEKDDWYYTIYPYVVYPLKSISITMAILWVVVLAVERYLAVTFPLKTRHRLFYHILFLVAASVTINCGK